MARGRAPGYDGQRQLIVDEAARLFARQGYSATSMNQLADACGLSKATIYHYYRDKYSLLVGIADEHVSRLQELVERMTATALPAQARLERMIHGIVAEYAGAQDAHRVLTEDVKFLLPEDQARVLDKERQVVAGFARAVTDLRPELEAAGLAKPLTMLLFGMINWMFTWMKPEGELTYQDMAPVVSDLFFGGLPAVARRPRSASGTSLAGSAPAPGGRAKPHSRRQSEVSTKRRGGAN